MYLSCGILIEMPPKVPKTFFLDGVCLSESGLNQIRELSLKYTEKKQRQKRNPSTHPALLMMMSMSMSEKSEDDQENTDSKTATMGWCQTAVYICLPYSVVRSRGVWYFLESRSSCRNLYFLESKK